MAEVNNKIERVLIAIGSAADAKKNNILLLKGELAIESDTYKAKLGDGKTRYNSLPYLPYSEITRTLISAWNQAVNDGKSWKNSPAFTITMTDINNWNSVSGVTEDDVVALATAL